MVKKKVQDISFYPTSAPRFIASRFPLRCHITFNYRFNARASRH